MTDGFVGIDVSDSGLRLAVHQSDFRFECPLDPSTSKTLIDELERLEPKLIVLEASRSGTEIPLAAALHTVGLPAVVFDATAVRKFARKESVDGSQAEILASFAASASPQT